MWPRPQAQRWRSGPVPAGNGGLLRAAGDTGLYPTDDGAITALEVVARRNLGKGRECKDLETRGKAARR